MSKLHFGTRAVADGAAQLPAVAISMTLLRRVLLLTSMAGLLACTASSHAPGAADSGNRVSDGSVRHDAGHDAGHDTAPDAAAVPCSVDASDPSLPGATVHIAADRCNFRSGQGGQFRYRVVLTKPIPYSVQASTSCGACSVYSNDAAARIRFTISNGLVQYCECDGGCCPPNKSASYTLDAKTVDGTIDWPGLQWQGASDTNTSYGPPFPPGRYFVMVTLDVPGVGVATAGLPITVK